jgi:hypothetical protein
MRILPLGWHSSPSSRIIDHGYLPCYIVVCRILGMLSPVRFEAGDELADRLLALAPHDVVGVDERLVGAKAHVRAAEDDRHPGAGEEVGEPVGGRRGGRRRGDPDEVGAEKVVEVDRCEHLAIDADVVARGGKHLADEREPETGQADAVVDVTAGRTGLNQANSQTHRPLCPPRAGWPANGTGLELGLVRIARALAERVARPGESVGARSPARLAATAVAGKTSRAVQRLGQRSLADAAEIEEQRAAGAHVATMRDEDHALETAYFLPSARTSWSCGLWIL